MGASWFEQPRRDRSLTLEVMRKAQIIGAGLYAPERVVPNRYFDDYYGEDVGTFLRERRNIHERRYAAEDETTSDLVVAAAQHALDAAGIAADALDLIIVATDTPDYLSPATAAVVQHKLGATHAGTFDLNTACAGFVTALDVGSKYLVADTQYRHVLVAGAYLMSRFIDFEQRNTATLFADGAGAVVLRPTEDEHGILRATLRAEGQYHGYMGVYAGGACHPIRPGADGQDAQRLEFRKKFPPAYNRAHWTALIGDLSEQLGVAPGDVTHYFFTQINVESIRETMDALGLPAEKAHTIMDRYGYTGSACIPMALADAGAGHKLKRGDLVYLIASGGGAALAALALRWAYDT